MTPESETVNGIQGLKSEVSRLNEMLQIRTGELKDANSKLSHKEQEVISLQDKLALQEVIALEAAEVSANRGNGEGEGEMEVEKLKTEVDSLRQQLEASQKEVDRLKKEQTDQESAFAELDREFRRVNHQLLASANENVHLRRSVEELVKEKREYVEKSKSMDAKVMHAAAEAELTRMGHRPPSDGWSTTSVALVSIAAAVGGGLVVAYLKRSPS